MRLECFLLEGSGSQNSRPSSGRIDRPAFPRVKGNIERSLDFELEHHKTIPRIHSQL
jgi:hypothetical protein